MNFMNNDLLEGRGGIDEDLHSFLLKINDSKDQFGLFAMELEQLRVSMKSQSSLVISRSLVKSIYLLVLGCDPSAQVLVNAMTQCRTATNMHHKRVAYLVVSLLLAMDNSSEIGLLTLNTLQKDLSSPAATEVSMALSVVTSLCHSASIVEAVTLLLPHLEWNLQSDSECIRYKALATLSAIYSTNSQLLPYSSIKKMKKLLADPSPAVTCAALSALTPMVADNPSAFKPLVAPVLHILRQTMEARLDASYSINGIQAPFLQLASLRILTLLSADASQTIFKLIQTLPPLESTTDAAYFMMAIEYTRCLSVNASGLPVIQQIVTALLSNKALMATHCAVECLLVVSQAHPQWTRQTFWDTCLNIFTATETPIALNKQLIDVSVAICDEAVYHTVLKMVIGFIGKGSASISSQTECCKYVQLIVERYFGNEECAESAGTVYLDCFQVLSDEARPFVNRRIVQSIVLGKIPEQVALKQAEQWVQEASRSEGVLYRNKLWLAVWICGHYGSNASLTTLCDLLNSFDVETTRLEAELIGHCMDNIIHLTVSVLKTEFTLAVIEAFNRFENVTEVTISTRFIQFLTHQKQ